MSWRGKIPDQILKAIAHPKWCPAEDLIILNSFTQGVPQFRLAERLNKKSNLNLQRWHRLRKVPGVLRALEQHPQGWEPYAYEDAE